MRLYEQLFARGFMVYDPQKQSATFNPTVAAEFPAARKEKMQEFRWLVGNWDSVNRVPATATTPAFTDVNQYTYNFVEDDTRITIMGPSGKERPHLTFDPFSARWMMTFVESAYGVLQSEGWRDNVIVFSGRVTMLGVDCELRQTITLRSHDEFHALNEEMLPSGEWIAVDEFECRRK